MKGLRRRQRFLLHLRQMQLQSELWSEGVQRKELVMN